MLPTLANDDAALLFRCPECRDAGGRVVDYTELEVALPVGLTRELPVEGDLGVRFINRAKNP